MKLALLVLLAPAIAAADPLAFTVAGKGSQLELTFKNTSAKPVTMTTHVRAGLDHYDWLTVKLVGKTTKRTLRFIEVRTKAIPVDETIAPGKSLTRSVDLVAWSWIAGNGEPLLPESYDVEATWDTTASASGPRVKLIAKTRLAIPAPIETGCTETGKPKDKLALYTRQVGSGMVFEVGLHNTDTVARCIYGIIQTHEIQNDWLTLSFAIPGEPMPRTIKFSGDRDKSYPKTYELPPGAALWTTWDLAEWNKRQPGAKPLPSNINLWVTATWDASRERAVWNGVLTSRFGMRLP
jgi:hypothetical protein